MSAPSENPSPIVEKLRGLWQHEQDAAWEFVTQLVRDADDQQKPGEAPSQASAVALAYVLGQWNQLGWGTPHGTPKQRLAVGHYRHRSPWRVLPTDALKKALEAKLQEHIELMEDMLFDDHDQAMLAALIKEQAASLDQAPSPQAEPVELQVRELVALKAWGAALVQAYIDDALACGSSDWWLSEARARTPAKPTPCSDDAKHLARSIWPAVHIELLQRAGLETRSLKAMGIGLSVWPYAARKST